MPAGRLGGPGLAWETLATALDLAPAGIVVSSRDGRWVYVNSTFAGMLGAPAEVLLGRTVLDVVHPDDALAALEAMEALRSDSATRHGLQVDLRLLRTDGSTIPTRVMATVIGTGDEEHRVTVLEDRTRELAAQDELFPPEIAAVYRANDEALLASGERHTREVPVNDPLLGLRTFSAATFPLREGDRVWGIACVGHDVTEQVRLRAELQTTAQVRTDEARTDPVTGLPNRRLVVEATEAALAVGGTGAAVVFCDLDGFKDVNDKLGHDAEDALLVAVGASLQAAVRPGDVVGRWGGDEFVVVCAGTPSAADVSSLQRRLTAAISAVTRPDGRRAQGSVGLVAAEPGDDVGQVLAAADQAMYAQKRRGRTVARLPEQRAELVRSSAPD